ncbi:chorismate dehydratase [Methanophagales archaeon]|nr:chorismate dehydratase [Methanophagales archaeon]
MSVKIGKFGFVNNYLPYYQFEQNGLKVIEALPKQLAEMFERGELDFAPVPSFYYIKNRAKLKSYEFCVASKDSVLSVIIVSNGKKLDGVNGSIAVTNQTVTSLNLLKIILREKGQKNSVVVLNEGKTSELLKRCNYALVIGDEAIKARMTHKVVMDLGEEWHKLTGYPMVFGISVSRKEVDMSEINSKVMESVEWGTSNVDLVVSEAEKKFGMPVEFLARYFRSLTFRLGAQEKKGLELFGEKCYEYGLL